MASAATLTAPVATARLYVGWLLDPSPMSLLVPKTTLTGGTASSLDALATVALAPPVVVSVVVGGVTSLWTLYAGTDAHDPSAGVVRPLDFHATTNAKVWKQNL